MSNSATARGTLGVIAKHSGSTGRRCAYRVLRATALVLVFVVNADATLAALPEQSLGRRVTLRVAWGGESRSSRWHGTISVMGGTLESYRQFGIAPDAPGSIWLEDGVLQIARRGPRSFDGVDITLRTAGADVLRIALTNDNLPLPKTIAIPVSDVTTGVHRSQIDDVGNELIVHRSPGDQLRISFARRHLIFDPEEQFTCDVVGDFVAADPSLPQSYRLDVTPIDGSEYLRSEETTVEPSSTNAVPAARFSIAAPTSEGVYQLTITATQPRASAIRFVPSVGSRTLGRRTIQIVVFDQDRAPARLPIDGANGWQPVLEIDPANPRWWTRLPRWAQVQRLAGYPQGRLESTAMTVGEDELGRFVVIPAPGEAREPNWLAYPLPLERPGTAHRLVIEYPRDSGQQLGFRLLEPNAAGLLDAVGVDSGVYDRHDLVENARESGRHEIVFWPRTSAPHLLVTNRHPRKSARLGKIQLYQQPAAAAERTPSHDRLVAGLVARPTFPESFGAPGSPDGAHVIDDWQTFYTSGVRLAQVLHQSGYNAAVLAAAADGSALYPSALLEPTPLHDTGYLSVLAADPIKKDALELLYRIFDRQRMRLIPTVTFSTPIPRLERRADEVTSRQTGIRLIGEDGRDWLQVHGYGSGRVAYYNLLSKEVQQTIRDVVLELVDRYSDHSSYAGMAIQLDDTGFAHLPGPYWGIDDATVFRFEQATGKTVPGKGPNRFEIRSRALRNGLSRAWLKWRADEVTAFYHGLANDVAERAPGGKLLLLTSGMLDNQAARAALQLSRRGSELDGWFYRQGINLSALSRHPSVILPRPHRVTPNEPLEDYALDLQLEEAFELDGQLAESQIPAALFYHPPQQRRLASYDPHVPFGDGRSQAWLITQAVPDAAANRRRFVEQLAIGDPYAIIDGGDLFPTGQQHETRHVLRVLQQLPAEDVRVSTRDVQPVSVKTYRETDRTTIVVVNASPWEASTTLHVEADDGCRWEELTPGSGERVGDAVAREFGKDSRVMELSLPAYDLRAFRFQSPTAHVLSVTTETSELARSALQTRLSDLESRKPNLAVERRYAQLINPDFEEEAEDASLPGWRALEAEAGSQPQLIRSGAVQGDAYLSFSSGNQTTTIESDAFAAPKTGQLTVSFLARGKLSQAPAAELRIYVADDADEGKYRRYAVVTDQRRGGQLHEEWGEPIVHTFYDIPFGSNAQLRLRFELTGEGDVDIDDVRLYDLRFDQRERLKFVQMWRAAQLYFEQGRLLDCLAVLDGYWPRFLIENVPAEQSARLEPEPVRPAVPPAEQPAGLRDRLRAWLPKPFRG